MSMITNSAEEESVQEWLKKQNIALGEKDKNGETLMHYAAKAGYVDAIKWLHERNESIHTHDNDGWLPMHFAALFKKFEAVACLKSLGADVNAGTSCKLGKTSMHISAELGRVEVMEGLKTQGADIEARTIQGMAPLHFAVLARQMKVMEWLKTQGANINIAATAGSIAGATSMHFAALQNRPKEMEWLKMQGADIEARTVNGTSPMHMAAGAGHVAAMEWLERQGANIHAKNNHGDTTPIQLAAKEGHVEAVKWLLIHGADFDKKALSFADMGEHGEKVKKCYESHLKEMEQKRDEEAILAWIQSVGIKVGGKNEKGQTLMHLAATVGRVNAMKWLKKQGEDIKARDLEGAEPIHYAAGMGKTDVMEWLKLQGVDIKTKTSAGTPMHYAAMSGQIKTMNWLRNRGVDITAKDDQGYTPLDVARKMKQTEAATWLENATGGKEEGAKSSFSPQAQENTTNYLPMWWIAFGVSFSLSFTPVPTWLGVIAVMVTFVSFVGVVASSKPPINWILFGVSFLLFFAPVPTWFGVIAVIVTFFGALIASGAAEEKEREKEKKRLKVLADQGDVQAQYDLACLHQKCGELSKAIPYFEKAAKAGHAQAQSALIQTQYDLACKYQKSKKWSKAIPLFEKAAKAGHAQAQSALIQAQYDLACKYQKSKKWSEAIPLFEKAAKAGHAQAQSALEAASQAITKKPTEGKKKAKPKRSDSRGDGMDTIEDFIADASNTLEMMSCEYCQKDKQRMALQRGMFSSNLRGISEELWRLTEPPPDNVVRSLHSLVNLVNHTGMHLTDAGQISFQEIKKFLSTLRSHPGRKTTKAKTMRISEYDLCEKCRNLEIPVGDTFGGFIRICNEKRGGSFTNLMDFTEICEMIKVNLETRGGCPNCIQIMDRKRSDCLQQ